MPLRVMQFLLKFSITNLISTTSRAYDVIVATKPYCDYSLRSGTRESGLMECQNAATTKLDACRHIFLAKLETGPSLDLRIEVVEGRVQEEPVSIEIGDEVMEALLKEAHPILTREGYYAFRIVFENYICFSVRDETYAVPEDDEDYSRRLRKHERSTFLDFVSKGTWASSGHPGPVVHYAVVCDDHVIDVACNSEPTIEQRVVTAVDL